MSVACIRGHRISYSDTGSGTPVVLIPGLGGCKEWFSYQSLGLSDHCRLISFDPWLAQRGTDYSLEYLANQLTILLHYLRVHGALVVGHSFGALVALRFALENPQTLLGLVLCSAAPVFADVSHDELVSHFAPGGVIKQGFLAALWQRVLGSRRANNMRDDSAALAQSGRNLDEPTLHAAMDILRETDFTPTLDQIACPTLIVAGALDPPFVLAGSQLMDELLPGSELEVIEDSDQYYFCTRHDIFNDMIADWLRTFAG